MVTESQVSQVLDVIGSAAEFQLKHFRHLGAEVVDMKAVKETVSFVDVETEAILFNGLSDIVRGAGFYGEESGKSGNQELVWVVDPLDGTTNYLSGIDHFSISVSLVAKGVPVFGVVHQPYTNETIYAVKGEGVKVKGEFHKVQFPEVEASESLFVTGFPYRSEDLSQAFFKAAPQVLQLGRGIRRTGSAALDLAHVGCGWFQGFWESDLQPYDVAAAIAIMNESGVVVTNHKGEPYDMFEDRIMVAAFPKVYPKLIDIIAKEYGKELP